MDNCTRRIFNLVSQKFLGLSPFYDISDFARFNCIRILQAIALFSLTYSITLDLGLVLFTSLANQLIDGATAKLAIKRLFFTRQKNSSFGQVSSWLVLENLTFLGPFSKAGMGQKMSKTNLSYRSKKAKNSPKLFLFFTKLNLRLIPDIWSNIGF